MMPSFIHQLVTEILKKYSDNTADICVVFPTRRAGLFFQQELSSRIKSPVWSPEIFSIQDFIHKLSGKNIPDSLTLLFELYEVYKQYFTADDFARFYPWGELMLRDFDDIDSYLIDASKVFTTVTDLHQIDIDFALEEEDLERLRTFWKNFFDRDPSLLRNEFMNTWKFLGQIYTTYRKRLRAKNFAYQGMAYRDLTESLKSIQRLPEFENKQIIFAGFYALTPAEQSIIKVFVDSGRGHLYWDADSYYADDDKQEAGKFFRNNILIEGNYLWKENYFRDEKKNIEIAGVPLMVGQARYAGNILSNLISQEHFKSEKTAVVLPDEKLLFPVLYSIPSELKDINVTMGYPLHQTPLFNLFEAIMGLQRNARKSKEGEVTYFFRDVMNILNHPYVRLMADQPVKKWLNELKDNYIRIPHNKLVTDKSDEAFKNLFVYFETVPKAFEFFRKILRGILEAMKEEGFRFHNLESEFVYHFYTHLRRLEDIMKEGSVVNDIETFWKIFREVIFSVRIPFSGEPLKGLQIMGFLETRVLDFDNVIILSVNEDVLPSAGNKPSFIPYNIRKAFGLPTFEDQNAVSAFHFYRLLQRAKNIYLIHNTESKALTTGERSRFLLQLEYELQRKFPDSITITNKVISTKVSKEVVDPIEIKKSPAVMLELSKYLNGTPGQKPKISPSSLSSYIACPLRFYFQYVAGLKEQEEAEENMESATFGKVLHKAMQLLYSNVYEIDDTTLNKLKKKINDTVDEAIHLEFISINQLEGKNILLRNVIRELVARIIETDRLDAPFRILQLEKDVSMMFTTLKGHAVKLQGIIDRVDEVNGITRIIDYKTGRMKFNKPDSLEDYFTNPDLKEQFQAMYYAFLTNRINPGRSLKSGLIALREMAEGIWYLNNNEPFTNDLFKEFEMHLNNLLDQIFSSEVPFVQTNETERCEYCSFKSICNRN